MSSTSDPAAALGDAWRRAREAFRFTSVRGREDTGTHLLRIGNHSTVDSLLPRGECVESEPFRAGGHRWKLEYYPNGYKANSASGRPSVRLGLMENRFVGQAKDARAKYSVAILDGDGEPVYRRSMTPLRHYSLRAGTGGYSGIWCEVLEDATAEEAKQVLRVLKGDSLVLRCDVAVQSLEKESRIKLFLRRFLE